MKLGRKKRILKCSWVLQQTIQASKTGEVTIRSGHTIPVWLAFRCLYCGEYFNQDGAEEHFGESRADYRGGDSDDVLKENEIIFIRAPKRSDIR